MSQTTYQITLATDGRFSVAVTSDDPVAVQDGLAWAKGIHLKLLAYAEEQGFPVQPEPEAPPICAVHQVPMVCVQGRKGPFWSCHQKNDDGSWCAYKPKSL